MQHPQDDASSPAFGIRTSAFGTTQSVAVSGEVDLAVSGHLTAAIDSSIAENPEMLVIDLSAAEFLDTATVHCLLHAQRHAAARSVRLVIIPAPAHAHRVFTACDLDRTLPFVPAHTPAAA